VISNDCAGSNIIQKVYYCETFFEKVVKQDKKVLICDDVATNLLALSLLLKNLNVECDSANNGFEAIEMVKMRNYSLIIMDIEMPGKDGY
jgi:CheY-like chemotaxis protein